MAIQNTSIDLVSVVALLGAAVAIVPLFRRFRLGSILGYLAAGLLIGPFGLKWFTHPQTIVHIAELGVVMFLFVIGLEMRPSHLWGLRREIFGLGTLQIAVCAAVLTGLAFAVGYPLPIAFIAAMGFVMTSTAIVVQLLTERGDVSLPHGQRVVSILLFEDLLIVPLLALVAFMSPTTVDTGVAARLQSIGIAIATIAGIIAAGVWLLNPFFRILAAAKAREVMTAAALLVVLGAALVMQLGGLSMAMGAFLAGVLLSESTFRHQIEADIEPFRGLLLGLFFLGVGMSLDLGLVIGNWRVIVIGTLLFMAAKASSIYVVARLTRASHPEALDRAAIMAQGGEFAFVLFSAAAASNLIAANVNANLTAIVVLSMVLTPIVVIAVRRCAPKAAQSMEGVETANGLSGSVLIIGFGRFGQVMSQALLARQVDVAIIDTDIEMIRSAGNFGFKVYYGDGTRLDVLRACGAETAHAIAICIDDRDATNRIVELAHAEFPQAQLLVRSFDREHSLRLIGAGVDYQIRETFESALQFGAAALQAVGVSEEEAREISDEMRRRDAERFELELAGGGLEAGKLMLHGNLPKPTPTPFTKPKRTARPLNERAEIATRGAGADGG
jgi:glutathione-regulated potassium-efflux system protein KefB